MKKEEKKVEALEEKTLLTFLQRTKEGKYAKVDKNSLIYSRIKIQREETYSDEEYLYSVR